ncbi:hypothetical protein [Oceanobacillus jeddahense]|uniref:hypothetical protein n=1 Tax=Oceanobacillus jeddahense TaxID=1462527 RepID=UPI0005963C3D|nr:hypothetical protein [Oceanobacillus jeddahense]
MEISFTDNISDLHDDQYENEITPFARSKRWFATSKTYQGLTYGSWQYAGASTTSGDTVYLRLIQRVLALAIPVN